MPLFRFSSKYRTSTGVDIGTSPQFAAASFAGKYAIFQRHNGTLGRWIKVERTLLRANATGVAQTVI